MPIIKSAKKKLRKDKKRTKHNREIKDLMKEAIKIAKTKKTEATITKAISIVNKAAKRNIIHKNKAARLTSVLAKLAKSPSKKETPKKKTGKTNKKSVKKV